MKKIVLKLTDGEANELYIFIAVLTNVNITMVFITGVRKSLNVKEKVQLRQDFKDLGIKMTQATAQLESTKIKS